MQGFFREFVGSGGMRGNPRSASSSRHGPVKKADRALIQAWMLGGDRWSLRFLESPANAENPLFRIDQCFAGFHTL
jgi:hypothetical protein